nr:RNA-directed DNA polymerase, eukaryota [Tanacetum cinerariifolium]
DSCLRLSYPRLFALENNKVCKVAAKMSAPFVSSLRRDVRGGEESAQLSRIFDLLDTVVLSNMEDRRFWDLNGDGCFRVKDVRRMLGDMLLPKFDVLSRWVKQILIKVDVLAWKISMDRLPTQVNLHRRRVQMSAPFVSSLRRDIRGGEESAQISRISDLLDIVVLSNMEDRRFWDLNGDGCFRVKDVRRMLDDMLLPKSDVPSRWVKQIPINVNVLACKISMDRLPTRVNLHRLGVQIADMFGSVWFRMIPPGYMSSLQIADVFGCLVTCLLYRLQMCLVVVLLWFVCTCLDYFEIETSSSTESTLWDASLCFSVFCLFYVWQAPSVHRCGISNTASGKFGSDRVLQISEEALVLGEVGDGPRHQVSRGHHTLDSCYTRIEKNANMIWVSV